MIRNWCKNTFKYHHIILITNNRSSLEEETRVRSKLQAEVRNMHSEVNTLHENLEEEQEARAELQRALTKANNEAAIWKQRFTSGEGSVRSEELDELKRKMQSKVAELETALESSQSKCSSLEKTKMRMQNELEDVLAEVERVGFLPIYKATTSFSRISSKDIQSLTVGFLLPVCSGTPVALYNFS